MALYLGSNKKYKVAMNGASFRPKVIAKTPVSNNIRLLSSDNYILKDSTGTYLIAKEDN